MPFELSLDARGVLAPEWLAETVRITAFNPARRLGPIWQNVMKVSPAEVTERPGNKQRFEAGDFGAGGLLIQQQEGRTDFYYTAKLAPNGDSQPGVGGRPHIGPLGAAITALVKLLSAHEELFAGAVRLAFAPSAFRGGNSDNEINSFIAANSSITIGPQDRDILWSFNRPVPANSFAGQ